MEYFIYVMLERINIHESSNLLVISKSKHYKINYLHDHINLSKGFFMVATTQWG